MGVDFEQWSKKIGCFCNCFRRAKLHGYKYTSRWSNSTIVPGIHLTFSWQLIITLLLLASGEEPNPGSSRPSVSSCDAGLEFPTWNLLCFRCSKHTLVSCLVSSLKLQSGVPLKNSHKWQCDFLSYHHFLYVCENCTGISPSYNDAACPPVRITSHQIEILSKDMPMSGHAVNVSDALETDSKLQSSDYVATRQVNQCLEDIVSKCNTISHELDKLRDKLVFS